jgi:hypothetical protein
MMSLEQAAHAAFTEKIMALPPYYQEQILGTTFEAMLDQAKIAARKAIFADMELLVPHLVCAESDAMQTGYHKYYDSADMSADTVASATRIAGEVMSDLYVKRAPLPALAAWGFTDEDYGCDYIPSEDEDDGYDSH